MSHFGDELRRLRRATGLSQESLAARAGLSPEAVSLLERGRRSPRLTTIRLIAEGLHLPESDRAALFAAAQPSEPTAQPLPSFPNALIHRETDLAALSVLADRPDVRLITVLGPGGVGKTRIAVEYARRHTADFPDGTHWLPVGPLVDGAMVVPAMAGALGVRATPYPEIDDVVERLRPQNALVIIDNAEHQLAECRAVCRALLAGAPEVMIVVTSRHLIEVPGEAAFSVAPLALPDPAGSADEVAASPAAQLFLSRAGMTALSAADRDAVVRLCHRLDGLPLALELAAARTNVLTVGELAAALDDRLAILATSGPRGDEHLVDAMVSWSYHTLDDRERGLFELLAVFTAGFDREAVAVVANGLSPIQVLDALSSLVSKSLVYRHDDGGPRARFRLLHLIRQYAEVRLDRRPDVGSIRERHARHYAGLAIHAARHLTSLDEPAWLATVDRELGNLRRAIAWSLDRQPRLALELVTALGRWCYLRGRYSDGRAWALDALAADPDAPGAQLAPVLQLAATLAFLQCDYADARRLSERALAHYRHDGDRAGIAWSVARLGSIAREEGQYERSETLHREALALAVEAGDAYGQANQLNFLCFVTWISGRADDAEPLGRDALVRMRELGNSEGLIWALINLGAVARYRGELDRAGQLLRQCLELCEELTFPEGIGWASEQLAGVARSLGDHVRALGLARAALAEHDALGDRWRAASAHDELAAIAIELAEPEPAARHLHAAERLRSEIGAPVPAIERPGRERTERAARQALGAAYELAGWTDARQPRPM